MLALLVILMVTSMTFAGDTPPEECEGCFQLPPSHDTYDPEGACCFGDHWVKCTTKDNCEVLGFVWAGPLTDSNACKHLKPCCMPDGTCTDALCFDCIKLHNGKPIDDCEDCQPTPTPAPTTTKTKHTKPPHTTHTTPTTTPNGPDDGCCCLPDGSVPIMTSCDDCHTQGGIYRGDGKSCDIEGICLVKCCDTNTNTCLDGIESKDECEEISGGVFHGVGECTEATCGGSCCIHGRAVIAYSEKECCERGGTFQGFGTPLDDGVCPRACCLPGDDHRHCEIRTPEDCVDRDGIPFNAGDTCHTIKCFGACCKDGEQSETSSTGSQLSETFGPSTCALVDNTPQIPAQQTCEEEGGVYQGDGSQCPLLVLSDASDSTSDTSELSLDSPSSSTPSLNSDTSYVEPNGQCLNDGACCLRDKEQGDDNGCVRTGTIALCVSMNGTFQGIGTRCTDTKICKKSACCLGDKGGCIDVHIGDNGLVECKLKGGRYVGDGTTCSLPGMCDKDSGACCCDGQCINMPNATTCYDYGGCSFRGTGTDCCHEGLCEDKNKDEGACCIQNSYLEDGAQCVIMPNAIACAFRGGVWRGKKTNCDNADYTCGPLTGVCCVDGIAYDDQTASECKKCGGTFAGPGSSSGDEGVCDPTHRGACCKKMHGCSDTTYAQCKKQGGNFQGPGTCCNDRDICTPCEPCNTDAPKCSSDEDCPSESVCVAQFGNCMVPASRIKQKRIWNPLQHSRAMHLKVVPPAKPFVTARAAAEHHHNKESTSSSSSSDSDDGGWGEAHHDDDIPDGPFSCGSVDTIGRACVVHPCSGKCAIGVCGAPPPGTVSDGCQSLCLRIHEYDCNCECRDPWWETCAFIAGATYNDTDSDNTLDINVDELFTETPFDVKLFSVPSNGDDDVLVDTKTSTDGRFSFSGLPGGTYNVILQTPAGYRIEDDNGPAQQVTVTCIPPGEIPPTDIAKRNVLGNGVHSQVLTIVNGKTMSSHIKDNVYYLIAPGDSGDNIEGDETVPNSPVTNALSSGSSAGVVIAIIIIGVVVVCLAVLVFGFLTSRRRRVYTTQQRVVQTNLRR